MFNLPSTEQQQASSPSPQPAITNCHKRLGALERRLQRACRLCRKGLGHNWQVEEFGSDAAMDLEHGEVRCMDGGTHAGLERWMMDLDHGDGTWMIEAGKSIG